MVKPSFQKVYVTSAPLRFETLMYELSCHDVHAQLLSADLCPARGHRFVAISTIEWLALSGQIINQEYLRVPLWLKKTYTHYGHTNTEGTQ